MVVLVTHYQSIPPLMLRGEACLLSEQTLTWNILTDSRDQEPTTHQSTFILDSVCKLVFKFMWKVFPLGTLRNVKSKCSFSVPHVVHVSFCLCQLWVLWVERCSCCPCWILVMWLPPEMSRVVSLNLSQSVTKVILVPFWLYVLFYLWVL